ncbi:MAG: hypothetical protein Q8M83_00795 [bacterium]|nr:hypothetical protein [bacterium]
MAKKISLDKKKKVNKDKNGSNFSADKLLANPATKKLLIQKLMSVPEVRQLIIKTVIEKTLS